MSQMPIEGNRRVAIKFLLSNSMTGSLIGTGGHAIKELMSETEAKVLVSSSTDTYPGTNDRVVLISGTKVAVSLAQTLIWEMIALNRSAAESGDERNAAWNPKEVLANLGQNALVEVGAKVTVPAAAGGLILGRAGQTIRGISEESGAKVTMSGKDDAIFTQERVLTITGKAACCIQAMDMVLNKLCEEEDATNFVYKGTSYHAITQNANYAATGGGAGFGSPYGVFNPAMGMAGAPMGRGGRGMGGVPMGGMGPGGPGMRRDPMGGMDGAQGGMYAPHGHLAQQHPGGGEMVQGADTTITLAVPNELIGNIIGRQGATLREIMSLSGAKVTISAREDMIEGTTNRTVTITGNPVCAQTAHMFIAQRLQNPSAPPRRNPTA